MSRWLALPIAIVGGAVIAQFLYMAAGMAVLGVAGLFGLDDDLWNSASLSTILFVIVALACWVASAWFIWRALIARVGKSR